MDRFLVLVTIFWIDKTKDTAIVNLLEAIEMDLSDHPDIFDLDIQVWEHDNQ